MNERTRLERAAIDARAVGTTWAEFWPTVAADVAKAEPHDARRYHRFVGRLIGLVAAGDVDGAMPVGDGWPRPCAWELEDRGRQQPSRGRKMKTTPPADAKPPSLARSGLRCGDRERKAKR